MLPLHTLLPPAALTALITATTLSSLSPSRPPRDRALDALLAAHLSSPNVAQLELLFSPRKLSPTFPGAPGKTYLSLLAAVMLPHSRGSIHITSTSPLAAPRISPRAFTAPADRTILLAGLRFADRLARTAPLRDFLLRRVEPPAGGGELSDTEWWAHVRRTAQTVKHPVGTCAMLPREKGGVVDERLRVYGVRGVRVVDASVFPGEVAAHIQATVYAVAEKAAVMVAEDWGGI